MGAGAAEVYPSDPIKWSNRPLGQSCSKDDLSHESVRDRLRLNDKGQADCSTRPVANREKGGKPRPATRIVLQLPVVARTIRIELFVTSGTKFTFFKCNFLSGQPSPPPSAGMKWTSLFSLTASRTPPVAISPSMETAIDGRMSPSWSNCWSIPGNCWPRCRTSSRIDFPGTSTRSMPPVNLRSSAGNDDGRHAKIKRGEH